MPGEKAKVQEIYVEVKYNGEDKTDKPKIQCVSRVCQNETLNVEDMAEVSPINTKDLLINIQNRYTQNLIFTYVGETLIVVNPYQIIPGIYDESKMKIIIQTSEENTQQGINKYLKGSPHIYETTMNTIYDLIADKKDQAIVISGESGAGKTEAAKLCMKFIAYFFSKKAEGGIKEASLEDKILACNPVLESFGNSKTVRNDNSSRFGKYIKIFINIESKEIVGAFMETYLLEKSRVVSIAPNERNYHIFYAVISGFNILIKEKFNYETVFKQLEGMKLHINNKAKEYINKNLNADLIKNFFNLKEIAQIEMDKYGYLKNNVYQVEKINDVVNFFETIEGMVNTNFSDEEINYVLKITSAVLLISKIEFEEEIEEKCRIAESGKQIVIKVCQLLNIDEKIFTEAILYNVRVIKGETLKTDLKLADCKSYRDTISKEIYNRLFGFLVKRMNLTLFDEKIRSVIESDSNVKHIGLLDIFGFECFIENSFEQFCINFANEKLQNLYVEDIFKEIENMFIREGLKDHFHQIEFKDNKPILDVMGGYPNGVFFQLDNECNVSQKDSNFLSKIFAAQKNSSCLSNSRKNQNNFFIFHTAKDVEYNSNGFCTKNLDDFKLRMKESIISIKDPIMLNIIGEEDEAIVGKKEKYLGGKFRVDMNNLANALGACARHYIRCLKPNEEKRKNYFVPFFSLQQIKYMGILDTIKIRQEGYPIKKTLHEFYLRYEDAIDFKGKLFYTKVSSENSNLHEWDELINKTLMPDSSPEVVLFGKTVILMKQKYYDDIDRSRLKAIEYKEKQVTKIALKYRGRKYHEQFTLFSKAIYTLQQNYKIIEHTQKMEKIRTITKILQTKARINSIKEYNKTYISNIKKVKELVSAFSYKRRTKEAYIKVCQMKIVLRKYVKELKHKKYLKYRHTVKGIIEKKIETFIIQSYIPSLLIIQKHMRSYKTKLKLGSLYDSIAQRRSTLKEEIQCKKIQKHFRKHYFMNIICLKRSAADKFVGLMRVYKFRKWFVETRAKARIIQGAYKTRYLKRHIIETRLKEFTEIEDNLFEEANYVSAITLFPNHTITSDKQMGSTATLNKMNKLQKFYDKKVKNLNPTKLFENSYLNHSPYDEPKLHFFAHVLDLDAIMNLNEIYETPWAETFQDVLKHNIKQNTPIQTIEIGEMHTALINNNGKTFTWGWNGNGQCAFNINKDREFQYEEFNFTKRKQNPNVIHHDINEAPASIEGGVEEDFDFDSEINQIKEEKELFEDDEEERTGFTKNDFSNFYYLQNPMIIDNFNVRKIKCGEDNTLLLTKDNKLYVFGANYDHQLGVLKNRNVFSPMSLTDIVKAQQETPRVNLKSKIIDMKIAGKTCVLLNENGNIIFLSSLIEDKSYMNKTPFEIIVPEAKFASIECGKDFLLMLTGNGIAYSMGGNAYGQLGLGDLVSRTVPSLIRFFLDKKLRVTQLSCGYKHSAAKANNKAYSWGCVRIITNKL